ncbi:EAL domain-containing protein, partial [Bacillus sp. D-CC]
INLSAIEFEQKDFVQIIISTIGEIGVPANSIDLELTERIAMVDEKETLAKLKALKSYGVHLSIDDFGTGYSSLAYLPLYPIDTLKIPREFVNRIGISTDGDEIIQTIISLAHTSNFPKWRVVDNKSNNENMDTKFTLKNRSLTAYLLKVNIRKTFYSI